MNGVRIIKREARERSREVTPVTETKRAGVMTAEARREAAAIVGSWVSEVRWKRRAEIERDLRLFGNGARGVTAA